MALTLVQPNVLDVSWDIYYKTAMTLAVTVKNSGWEFDQIICIARGGMFIGDMFSRKAMFNKPLGIIVTESYHDKEQGELKISAKIAMVADKLGKRVLIVDDLSDTGTTLERVKNLLQEQNPETEFKTAVLWLKTCSKIKPDYYADLIEEGVWIKQPFEIYDEKGFA